MTQFNVPDIRFLFIADFVEISGKVNLRNHSGPP
jgi:hypothetical protein